MCNLPIHATDASAEDSAAEGSEMMRLDVGIEVLERIENWALWCIERMPRHSCRSIEGRYKPEAPNDIPVIVINPLDAVIIERAMIGLDAHSKGLIKAHFVCRAPVNEVRRKFAIRFGQYEAEITRAIRAMENRLKSVDKSIA